MPNEVEVIPYATIVNTSEADIGIGEEVFISGYGKYDSSGDFSDELRGVDLPIISNDDEEDIINKPIHETHLSFFEPGSGKSAGGADSGGPAVINYESSLILVGVSSFGGFPNASNPPMYTNVRLFSDWISNTISDYNNMNSDIVLTSILDQAGEVIPIRDQRFFNRNVRIPSGNHIIVEFGGNLRMNENATITVESGAKLEIRNNGMISTNSCVLDWKGIIVQGALNGGVQPDHSDINLIWNNSGVVHIHNGGKIYNANIAIATFSHNLSFPFISPFNSFTGAIYLDDAELMNNDYGVIISRKSVTPIEDKSFILQSEISNGIGGVRMRSVNSFRIEETNIMNMSEYGISATASDVTI